MKNLKGYWKLFAICCAVFAIGFSISCSNENEVSVESSTTMKVSATKLAEFTDYFSKTIYPSEVYVSYRTWIKKLTDGLNDNETDLTDKEKFSIWLDANLDKTTFTSKEQALEIFDGCIAAQNTYRETYINFFEQLEDCDEDDLLIIFEPVFGGEYSWEVVTNNACITSCANTAAAAWDKAKKSYSVALNFSMAAGSNTLGLESALERESKKIDRQFMACAGACPV